MAMPNASVLAFCVALQILGNVAWNYKDSVTKIFCKEESHKCWDLCAYSDEVNEYAKLVDELITIRDQIKALRMESYFSKRKVEEFDGEIQSVTNTLREKIGRESLNRSVREVKP